MKQKLLPYILGCAMVAAMPFTAHATPSYEYANEIPTATPSPHSGDESQNGFTEYNDAQNAANSLAQTFTNSTTTGSGLGNTRSVASDLQDAYPVINQNEKQNYRTNHANTTLSQDLDDYRTDFAEASDAQGANDTPGITDLETSIPVFTMTIPAKTVLPIGATNWKIGQVEMNGQCFVNPDKIGLILTKQNFHHSSFTGTDESTQTNKVIEFDVKDASNGNSMVTTLDADGKTTKSANTKILTFYQDGTRSDTFPYAYSYTSEANAPYTDGQVANINEAKDLWVVPTSWANKTKGKYTGKITFTAYIINGSLVEGNDPKTAPFPKTVTGSEWWPDTTT